MALGGVRRSPGRLTLGVTGHREANAAFRANRAAILSAIDTILDLAQAGCDRAGLRGCVISPLAQGTDIETARLAVARGWDLRAPLPFGVAVNSAVNIDDPAERLALIDGGEPGPEARALATAMRDLAGQARCLQLAEDDATAIALIRACAAGDADAGYDQAGYDQAAAALGALVSDHAADAARIVIDHADLLLAVWDGFSPGGTGGTRHTMATALALGLPVLWIDARAPDRRALLTVPEDLARVADPRHLLDTAGLADWFGGIDGAVTESAGLDRERDDRSSPWLMRGYRWIEHRLGGTGPHGGPVHAPLAERLHALPDLPDGFVAAIEREVIARFDRADRVSTRLSDIYRGGMVLNFVASAAAILAGVSYLPLTGGQVKWPFALIEFVLLVGIVATTAVAQRRRWHARWFATRRLAEYLRHAPALLLLGLGRAAGTWPRGHDKPDSGANWPEIDARAAIERVGLPTMTITPAYLRAVLDQILRVHAEDQEAYHRAKAGRLTRVHHRLDALAETAFKLAMATVALYLLITLGAGLGVLGEDMPHAVSKPFTFLGVAFPTFGGALSGIRYFGDFERFAGISEVAAEKLAHVRERIEACLSRTSGSLRHGEVADLAMALDAIVIDELEEWQAVFANKAITVPA